MVHHPPGEAPIRREITVAIERSEGLALDLADWLLDREGGKEAPPSRDLRLAGVGWMPESNQFVTAATQRPGLAVEAQPAPFRREGRR
jgi:hypothetical protein